MVDTMRRMNDPWTDVCIAGTGLLAWMCSFMAWSRPLISYAALLASLVLSTITIIRMLRDRRREESSRKQE